QASTGSGYAGVLTYYSLIEDWGREYMGIELSSTLTPHVPVFLSFKVSPAAFGSTASNSMYWTCQGIGMRFYMQPFYETNSDPLPNDAAIRRDTALSDISSWITVSGSYVPYSAYQLLVIGNFFSDSLIGPMVINSSGLNPYAYAY